MSSLKYQSLRRNTSELCHIGRRTFNFLQLDLKILSLSKGGCAVAKMNVRTEDNKEAGKAWVV
jgi:hypothetical protein